MDSARFGRVLGKGARAAARGLYQAVDAATAPNPHAPHQPTSQPGPQRPLTPDQTPLQTPFQAVAQANAAYRAQKKAVAREARKAGKSFLAPFARAGRVLWLEVTGTFFALFTAIFLGYAWKYRAAVRLNAANSLTNADAHRHLLFSAGAAAVFGYFAVSSFVRARRRERRA